MFGDIKKQFCLRWDEIVLVPGLELGAFLLGELMMVIAVYGMGEKDSIFPLGTVMAIVVPGMLMVFLGMSSLPLYFNILVSMGMSRRRLLPALFGFAFLQNILGVGIAYLFCLLEKWIMQIAYAGIQIEVDLQFLFQWKYIVPVCMAVVALNAVMGALFLKYGNKVYTIFWVLWMMVCIGGQRMGHMLESGQDHAFSRICRRVVDLFYGFSEGGILMAAVLISAGLMAVAYRMLCKQQVML